MVWVPKCTNQDKQRPARPASAGVCRTALADTSSCPFCCAQLEDYLAPTEHYALAVRAATSDVEYRKLFEYNRREMGEGVVRCHRCGRQQPQPLQIKSLEDAGTCDKIV